MSKYQYVNEKLVNILKITYLQNTIKFYDFVYFCNR